MANTASAQKVIPVGFERSGFYKSSTHIPASSTPVIVTFDTTGADLTVYTPNSNYYWGIIGMIYCEADAHSLIIKSGSTTLTTLQFGANSGPAFKLGDGVPLFSLAKGATLVMQTATANPVAFTVFVQEFEYFKS